MSSTLISLSDLPVECCFAPPPVATDRLPRQAERDFLPFHELTPWDAQRAKNLCRSSGQVRPWPCLCAPKSSTTQHNSSWHVAISSLQACFVVQIRNGQAAFAQPWIAHSFRGLGVAKPSEVVLGPGGVYFGGAARLPEPKPPHDGNLHSNS